MAQNDERYIPQIPEALKNDPDRLLKRINKELMDIWRVFNKLEGRAGESSVRDYLRILGRLRIEEDPADTLHEVGTGEVHFSGGGLRLLPSHYAKVERTTNQSVNNTTLTPVDFTTTVADTSDPPMVNLTANDSVLYVQESGIYLVGAHVVWAINSTGRRYTAIYRGTGTTLTTELVNDQRSEGLGVETTIDNLDIVHEFSANEVISLHVEQSSGGALNLEAARLWAFRLWT